MSHVNFAPGQTLQNFSSQNDSSIDNNNKRMAHAPTYFLSQTNNNTEKSFALSHQQLDANNSPLHISGSN